MLFTKGRCKEKLKQTERPSILCMATRYSRLVSSGRCLEGKRDKNPVGKSIEPQGGKGGQSENRQSHKGEKVGKHAEPQGGDSRITDKATRGYSRKTDKATRGDSRKIVKATSGGQSHKGGTERSKSMVYSN